jgi:phosphate ABC transporter permease subunit PstA
MSAVSGGTVLPPVSRGRRRKDLTMRALLGLGTALALVPLVLVLWYVAKRGLGAWSAHFFTSDPTGNFLGDPGGVKSAIVGTVEIVALATVMAVPLGIGVALYLTEYGRDSRFARLVRYFVDVMTGVPSIVFGLFVYIVLILSGVGGGYAGWKGSVALALLMLPIVVRSAEVVLLLVPSALRESALALGAPRWRTIGKVVLPTALPGMITGVLLAIARAAGETAPLLFTAFGNQFWSTSLGQPIAAVPLQVFNYAISPYDDWHRQAWAGSLVLVALVLVIGILARLAVRRRYGGE